MQEQQNGQWHACVPCISNVNVRMVAACRNNKTGNGYTYALEFTRVVIFLPSYDVEVMASIFSGTLLSTALPNAAGKHITACEVHTSRNQVHCIVAFEVPRIQIHMQFRVSKHASRVAACSAELGVMVSVLLAEPAAAAAAGTQPSPQGTYNLTSHEVWVHKQGSHLGLVPITLCRS
jgi:hypothetical protein